MGEGMTRSLTGILVAACLILVAPSGTRADNYWLRNFTWFGVLDGKDLREGCGPGAPDRLRFIYNGIYQQQIRVYELARPAPGAPATFDSKVLTRLNLSSFTLDELFLGTKDITSHAVLDDRAFTQLIDTVVADGYTGPVPPGLSLPSDGFYWVVTGCLGGQYHINGWVYPTDRFKALRFPAFVFARDATGVAINQPRRTDAGERMRARSGNQSALDVSPAFDVKLDDGGVVGRVPGF